MSLELDCVVEVDYIVFDDLDADDNLTEEEFEEEFGLDPVTDPEEKARREEALEEAEAEVKAENEKYLNGQADWFEEINEFSDLPKVETVPLRVRDHANASSLMP